ncbi:MAG: glycosyltransferase family 39 protein [Magnetococcus sp. THC-1_WYH]
MKSFANSDILFDRLSGLVFLVLAVILLITCRDYGYSYDEVWQNRYYGKAVVSFYVTLGVDDRATHYLDFYLFGGLYDAISEMIAWLLPVDGHTTRRLINALTGFVCLVGAWKTGRHMAGPKGGFWSLICLASIPVFYGHMFINAKDIPVATGTIWTLYFLIRAAENPLRVPNSLLIKLGLAMALALGVRIGTIILLAYAGLALIFGLTIYGRQNNGKYNFLSLLKAAALPRIIGLPLLVTFSMVTVFWPAFLVNPSVIFAALDTSMRHPWGKTVLFKGAYVPSSDLPWDYLPVYIAVNLPDILTILAVPILVWSMMASYRSWQRLHARQAVGWSLLLVATLLPPLIIITQQTMIYDGMRHMLFIVPPFAVLTGIALASWGEILARSRRGLRIVLVGSLSVYFLHHVFIMIQLHPYEYTFYNHFAGGMPRAATQFETDYWITSYREAALKIIDHAREIAEKEKVAFEKRPFTVGVIYVPENLKPFLPGNFSVVEISKNKEVDFLVATTRWQGDKMFPQWPIMDRVARLGMTFAVIQSRLLERVSKPLP